MKSRWFKEERELSQDEQDDAIAHVKEVIINSSIVRERLTRICQEEIEKTYQDEEKYWEDNYQYTVLGAAARRRAFKDILALLEIG